MNDLVRLCCERACRRFGGSDGIFNSASFGIELKAVSQLEKVPDGRIVRTVLCGRDDIEVLSGNSHFRLISKGPESE